jgi:hypothetical protein
VAAGRDDHEDLSVIASSTVGGAIPNAQYIAHIVYGDVVLDAESAVLACPP